MFFFEDKKIVSFFKKPSLQNGRWRKICRWNAALVDFWVNGHLFDGDVAKKNWAVSEKQIHSNYFRKILKTSTDNIQQCNFASKTCKILMKTDNE